MGILTGILVGLGLSIPFWPYILAHFDLFFTFVKEGEAKIVVVGDSYVKTILSLNGYKVGNDGKIVPAPPKRKGLLVRWFGIYWIGIPPFRKIFKYPLRWVVYQPKDDEGGKKSIVKNATLNSTFVKDKVYYGEAESAETKEGMPLAIKFLVTLRVTNPYKAVFLINNWVETVVDRTTQQVRVYVGKKSYKSLLQKETFNPEKGFSGHLNRALARTIRDDYGVEFVSCDILSLDPSSEYREATTKAYIAEQNAVATRVGAEAEAYATKTTGEAEAEVIATKGRGRSLSLVAQTEAFESNPEAARAVLKAEVGIAQNIGSVFEAIGKGLGSKREGGE